MIVDLEMPKLDGAELLQKIRSNEVTKLLPVIVLTGHKDPDVRLRMHELGASGFLTKPLKFAELRATLAQFIDILPAIN